MFVLVFIAHHCHCLFDIIYDSRGQLLVQLTAFLSCHHCLLYLLCCHTWRINWLIDWSRSPCVDGYRRSVSMASLRLLRLLLLSLIVIRWSAVGFGYGYGRKWAWAISFGRRFGYGHNWISDTVPLSAKAETRKGGFGRSLNGKRRCKLQSLVLIASFLTSVFHNVK